MASYVACATCDQYSGHFLKRPSVQAGSSIAHRISIFLSASNIDLSRALHPAMGSVPVTTTRHFWRDPRIWLGINQRLGEAGILEGIARPRLELDAPRRDAGLRITPWRTSLRAERLREFFARDLIT